MKRVRGNEGKVVEEDWQIKNVWRNPNPNPNSGDPNKGFWSKQQREGKNWLDTR